jgi:hypothetical protein
MLISRLPQLEQGYSLDLDSMISGFRKQYRTQARAQVSGTCLRSVMCVKASQERDTLATPNRVSPIAGQHPPRRYADPPIRRYVSPPV